MSEIQWNEFEYSKEEITIKVEYWSKDFTMRNESEFGTMQYGMHMPYAAPFRYTEEVLREKYCNTVWSMFNAASRVLRSNPDFFTKYKYLNDEMVEHQDKYFKVWQERKRHMKSKFKAGEITLEKYRDFLKEFNYHKEKNKAEREQFFRNYVEIIAGSEKQCIGVLSGLLGKINSKENLNGGNHEKNISHSS